VSVGPAACNCEDPARVALQDSTALVLGGDANKKRKISEKKKIMKKSASFNSGSELFDALLMAAADDNEGGEIVSNAHNHEAPPPPLSAQKQQRSERKKRGSFNNFFDSFEQDVNTSCDKKAPFIRRNSVSMILNNPVLAQTGAGDRYVILEQGCWRWIRGLRRLIAVITTAYRPSPPRSPPPSQILTPTNI